LLCGAGPELSFCQANMGMFPFRLIGGLQVRVLSRVLFKSHFLDTIRYTIQWNPRLDICYKV
jgi:hypothetical protein